MQEPVRVRPVCVCMGPTPAPNTTRPPYAPTIRYVPDDPQPPGPTASSDLAEPVPGDNGKGTTSSGDPDATTARTIAIEGTAEAGAVPGQSPGTATAASGAVSGESGGTAAAPTGAVSDESGGATAAASGAVSGESAGTAATAAGTVSGGSAGPAAAAAGVLWQQSAGIGPHKTSKREQRAARQAIVNPREGVVRGWAPRG